MNNFDEPVKKAETDAEILDALQGAKLTQDEIRRGACGGMGLAFFRAYYEKLPEEVARRLTEIDTEAVEHITRATGLNLSGSLLDRFGEKLASDAAQALTSAVCLRQQTEAAEHMRELVAQQKAAQEPRKGLLAS